MPCALFYFQKVVKWCDNTIRVIKAARDNQIEVIYFQHDDGPGTGFSIGDEDFEIAEQVIPKEGEKIFIKNINSCFGNKDFADYVKDDTTLMLVGLQTNFCIDATVKSAFERGYKVIVPQGANSTFDNDYMTGEITYKYYNDMMWPNRFATCVSVDEAIKLMERKLSRDLNVSLFSNQYLVRKMCADDIAEVYTLCCKNSLYYQYCPPFVSEQSIMDDMNVLPPNKEMCDKYYLGFYDGEKLIAVMDFIMAYPDELTAFIGFFMTDVSIQNTGTGSKIINDLCAYLARIGMANVRLGWVKGNLQAEHFWHKNGFRETGVTYDTENYTVIVAQRGL